MGLVEEARRMADEQEAFFAPVGRGSAVDRDIQVKRRLADRAESNQRLRFLVENAHTGYHRNPNNPRAICEICRELDRLESRNDR